jgi:AraC-like DNA-binding protein
MYRERRSSIPGAVVWTGRSDGTPGRVLPDGCMDLLWIDGHLVVAGPDTAAFETLHPPGTVTSGLRFAPGTAAGVLGASAREFRDARVPLDQVWPGVEVGRAEAIVRRATSVGYALEEVVVAHGRAAAAGDPLVTEVVRRIQEGERVAAIAPAVGLSARHLQRVANDVFGYGPKLLARILRLQLALGMARRGLALAAVAARCGYADQAHLADDVRALTGTTLGGLGLGRRPDASDQPAPGASSGANRSTELPSGSSSAAYR